MSNRNVVIFSSLLLPSSQTFIRAQGEELQRFTPYYVGSRRVEGLSLPGDRTFVINQGGWPGIAEEGVFKLFGISPKLRQQIKQINPALIHAQFGLSGALALPLARSLNIPMLVHFRGADATVKDQYAQHASLNHWIYFRRREALKRETRLFLTVSKFIREKLLEQGFPPQKVVAHYHGVDVDTFKPDPAVERQPIVLFVGRLTEKKGCQYLIQAMAQVQTRMPEVKLVIIGDGLLRTQLEELAAQQLKNYQFLGLQPPEQVRNWMNRARILATPSITAAQGDSEGLPNVVLEAQAMGLPVVAFSHAGIPEAVVHGETGFLYPEKDWHSFAQGILQLLQNSTLWQHFSLKGRERMETSFNRRRQTEVLEKMYEAVLRGEL